MSLYGAFDRKKLFSELATADYNEDGVLQTPTQLRDAALKNLTGVSDIEAADFASFSVLSGFSEAELNVLDGAVAANNVASKAVLSDANNVIVRPGNILATEKGSGFSAAESYVSSVAKEGGLYKTSILLDLTGVVSAATEKDIIGNDDAANAHIGQITAARNGTIIAGRITCLETPGGGEVDIDLIAHETGTLAEDTAYDAGGTPIVVLAAAADWAVGDVKIATGFPAANDYLYLAVGTGTSPTAGTYTAGKFLIEFFGK